MQLCGSWFGSFQVHLTPPYRELLAIGSQFSCAEYAAEDYIAILKEHGFTISMSRKGNPYDNAQAESFMKTLKVGEVYVSEYRTFAEAQERIGEFIELIYNQECLQSALGYVSPVEFE